MKCWVCGGEATRTRKHFDVVRYYNSSAWFAEEVKPNKYRRCYCDKCMNQIEEQEAREAAEFIRLKKKRMFLTACATLEKQNTDMYAYKDAIDVVEDFVSRKPDKFDSSYEMLSAIVLVHNRIHAKAQQKVGRYQVDFLLPDLQCVLEIDGDRHKHRKEHDRKRDKAIKEILGVDWEVIRIKTEYLDQNAKALPKAINEILATRSKSS